MAEEDPAIHRSEQAEIDAHKAARAANLFDIRRLIGGLFVIYGVILTVLGLGESDASIAKSAWSSACCSWPGRSRGRWPRSSTRAQSRRAAGPGATGTTP